MKKILLSLVVLLTALQSLPAQDSLYVQYANRFQANRYLFSTVGLDSLEFFARSAMPIIRRYSNQFSAGYNDYRVNNLVNSDGTSNGTLVFGDPGLILWKPTTSDQSYNNDYTVESNRWTFKRSKESEHFVVFWDRMFGDHPNASTVPSDCRVDIDDLLKKAEKFYATNINRLGMVVVDKPESHKSRLHQYKMSIYLLYPGTHDGVTIDNWVATGAGNDNVIGTLWITPATCHPVGSTIAHEIGHSFQYQTYCDNIINGKSNDMRSGFRYGYPGSNGGCGFWEQCAQWQAHQDYPSETVSDYNFVNWVNHHHRHFEHEWQRYASYWEQYYWTERYGLKALGRIWNESVYPEDANQAYMRLFLDNNYDTLRAQLFEYAQKTVTLDFNDTRMYATNRTWNGIQPAYDAFTVALYDTLDGWKQIGYEQCPQPTGFNIIPLQVPAAGTEVTLDLRGVDAGSQLPKADAGNQVNADGQTVAKVRNYNVTAVGGHEGWAFGFVALCGSKRVYSPMTLVSNTDGAAASTLSGKATFQVPEGTTRLWAVVQGSPTEYRQCPWDDKEALDDQLPYQLKITGAKLK